MSVRFGSMGAGLFSAAKVRSDLYLTVGVVFLGFVVDKPSEGSYQSQPLTNLIP